jgi:cytochrome-b5 reductase
MTYFSPQYVNGVYIPSALLLIGVTITKRDWLPFAVAFAAIVGGWKIYSGGKKSHSPVSKLELTC